MRITAGFMGAFIAAGVCKQPGAAGSNTSASGSIPDVLFEEHPAAISSSQKQYLCELQRNNDKVSCELNFLNCSPNSRVQPWCHKQLNQCLAQADMNYLACISDFDAKFPTPAPRTAAPSYSQQPSPAPTQSPRPTVSNHPTQAPSQMPTRTNINYCAEPEFEECRAACEAYEQVCDYRDEICHEASYSTCLDVSRACKSARYLYTECVYSMTDSGDDKDSEGLSGKRWALTDSKAAFGTVVIGSLIVGTLICSRLANRQGASEQGSDTTENIRRLNIDWDSVSPVQYLAPRKPDCPICLEEFKPEEQRMRLVVPKTTIVLNNDPPDEENPSTEQYSKHAFHPDCLQAWMVRIENINARNERQRPGEARRSYEDPTNRQPFDRGDLRRDDPRAEVICDEDSPANVSTVDRTSGDLSLSATDPQLRTQDSHSSEQKARVVELELVEMNREKSQISASVHSLENAV